MVDGDADGDVHDVKTKLMMTINSKKDTLFLILTPLFCLPFILVVSSCLMMIHGLTSLVVPARLIPISITPFSPSMSAIYRLASHQQYSAIDWLGVC